MRYALKLFYDGAGYHGFQIQPGLTTIEAIILETLKKASYITNSRDSAFSYASRTDAGVSALSQVIAFNSPKPPNMRLINSLLPPGLVFWAQSETPDDFNPRRDALSKTYRYYSPFEGEDIELIKRCVRRLEGTHDFKKLSKPDKSRKTCCSIDRINVQLDCNVVLYEFKAKSFLWKLIRKTVSLLKLIGLGVFEPEIIDRVLDPEDSFDPQLQPAPADGLVLYDIKYSFDFQIDSYSLNRLREYLTRIEKYYRVKQQLNNGVLNYLNTLYMNTY
ncbi:MAG: tRNA pseudouridine(38-40) synthase TruA [Candidatus Odinarchaeum yellowstonii]|uniref:tRNA pseudouridine synthase A n=1 Tax=Odinarchaeota yellowstonii (strain LCB_4) TaxID=1841599 RepID=A0AAF0D3A7_ODILC|nr:MAG: tRNA pseudouridine(38-40) synthase TruA [Candidatus Odinarchaeum yellowstonii]